VASLREFDRQKEKLLANPKEVSIMGELISMNTKVMGEGGRASLLFQRHTHTHTHTINQHTIFSSFSSIFFLKKDPNTTHFNLESALKKAFKNSSNN
jgi:hypothetical protein